MPGKKEMTVEEEYKNRTQKKIKKYKRGPLARENNKTSFTDADLGSKSKSYSPPKYSGGGSSRKRWDKTKKKWVPAPE